VTMIPRFEVLNTQVLSATWYVLRRLRSGCVNAMEPGDHRAARRTTAERRDHPFLRSVTPHWYNHAAIPVAHFVNGNAQEC